MSFWQALTVLVGVVCLLNLVLTLGLLRRTQEHATKLAQGPDIPEPILAVGGRVDVFTAVTVDGETIDRSMLIEGTLVGFFDPLCETCHSHLPSFGKLAGSLPGGRQQVLAVVRKEEEAGDMVAVLEQVARVVVERRRGPVATAFHLQATPGFCTLGPDQVVRSHGYESEPRTVVAV